MRILFLGDIVGRSGREAVGAAPARAARSGSRIDLAVVNGENASHGFGLAPDMAEALFAAGADVITLGNHAWDRKEILPYISDHPRLIRPINFPPGTPGAGSVVVELPNGRRALVLNAMGRLFMDPLDCPFRATAELLARHRLGDTVHAIVADFHAEATSEKLAYGHSFDGQDVAWSSARTRMCPRRTTRSCRAAPPTRPMPACAATTTASSAWTRTIAATRFWKKLPGERLHPAEGEATLCGMLVETDDATGLARTWCARSASAAGSSPPKAVRLD